MLAVTPSFLQGAPFSNATSNNEGRLSRLDILALQDLARRDAFVNLTATECLAKINAAYQIDFESILFVTITDSTTSSLLQTASASSSNRRGLSDSTSVKFCLAQPSVLEQTCDVNLNGSLLGVVVLLNLLSIIAITTLLFCRSYKPLVSLGDALSSFLQRPDHTTSGSCLMTKPDAQEERWGLRQAKFWVPRNHSWFRTPSVPRWCATTFLWTAPTALAATALVLAIRADPNRAMSSFGNVSPHAVYILPPSTPLAGAALISALPQLLLAALYLATNSLLTTYYLSHESSLYALGRPRPLRVTSSPAGSQTTSLYLTLPRPWSWLLATLFAATAFVLSQSFSLVSVHLLTPDIPSSTTTMTTSLTILGFSGTGLLILLSLLVIPALIVLSLGFRRAPPAILANGQAVGNPLALAGGSCSAVLSAWCHAAPRDRDAELWKRPLTWGVVEGGGLVNVAHCTFTAGRAGDIDLGRSYA